MSARPVANPALVNYVVNDDLEDRMCKAQRQLNALAHFLSHYKSGDAFSSEDAGGLADLLYDIADTLQYTTTEGGA